MNCSPDGYINYFLNLATNIKYPLIVYVEFDILKKIMIYKPDINFENVHLKI